MHKQWNITQQYNGWMKWNEIMPYATIWMDLEGIMLTEMSGRERKIQLHMLIVTENKHVVAREGVEISKINEKD